MASLETRRPAFNGLEEVLAPKCDSPGRGAQGAELPDDDSWPTSTNIDPPTSAHTDQAPEQAGSSQLPVNLQSSAALQERAVKMLTGDGEHPRASGQAAAASEATNGLVLAAKAAVTGLWAAHAAEIRRCCAPVRIDKEEILGYLLADALGHPLLQPSCGKVPCCGFCSRAVGKRAGAQSTLAERRLAEAKRNAAAAARQIARATEALDDAQHETMCNVACNAVVNQAYDLKLCGRTVGAKRKAPAAPDIEKDPPVPPGGHWAMG